MCVRQQSSFNDIKQIGDFVIFRVQYLTNYFDQLQNIEQILVELRTKFIEMFLLTH